LGQPASAQLQDELRRFLHDDASATLHIRSYFFDRVNAAPPSLVTLAGGGWVGLQTGWLYDTVQLGAVGYTSQPLWAPQNHWETSDGTNIGANAVNPTTGALLSQQWEYNLDLQLRAEQMTLEMPDWLKPLQLRGRIAFVDQYLGHTTSSFTEYRVILNYEVTWNGSRR
jgi:hypothetical protein